ncbi:lycopene cyclase domain-containing protein [Corynebacterium stationis]|uniref:lycopene cyclase domain-containing protein n=1 Tax=Corynebacterium stationis TaxID=1705 RepID=UPI00076F8B14|nr:lycopene cyclase domain-containing protein [Corynebacterium stationis]AMJ45281.1 C50 carotenoid epsilon cyclase [Corynebacterium stationis]APT95710.1 C50 carotenoid epsilon cyclase [Corynebacterium stationis]AQX71735.1 C50 carotenoid epsilon cyclase [Corynebacterium stationis]ASJ19414.1 C50 carotenoid epsilon cyclase [Corynebacterium stationis]HJG64739.1 lycopene cyclase domain-containing protein [Corynebacterium stationis]
MTYLLISVPFLILSAMVWVQRRKTSKQQVRVTLTAAGLLLILTAIFDNLMIFADLVGYGEAENLGLKVGLVPIEDFFYPLFVVLLVTAWWPHEGEKR